MFTSHRALLSLKSVIADYFWRGVIRFAGRRICVPPFNPSLTTLGFISGLNVEKFNSSCVWNDLK